MGIYLVQLLYSLAIVFLKHMIKPSFEIFLLCIVANLFARLQ